MNLASLFSLCLLVGIQPVLASNFATKVVDATFKLYHPKSTSTCFLIKGTAEKSPLYLVTTAHTLERMEGETAILVLRKSVKEGAYQRLDFKIPIRKGEKELWHQHKKHDVAILPLGEPLPVQVSAIPVEWLADADRLKEVGVEICESLFLLTYPEQFEANAAGFPIARRGIFSSSPLLDVKNHPVFKGEFKTFSGDSGGPVFIPVKEKKEPLIVGLVLKKFFHDEKIKHEYGETLVRHPLNIGGVLHACFIREVYDLVSAAE